MAKSTEDARKPTARRTQPSLPVPLHCDCDCSCDILYPVLLPGTALLRQHCPIWTCRFQGVCEHWYLSFLSQELDNQAPSTGDKPISPKHLAFHNLRSTSPPFLSKNPCTFLSSLRLTYHPRALDSPDKEQHHLKPPKLRTSLCIPHLIQHNSTSYTPLPRIMTALARWTSLIEVRFWWLGSTQSAGASSVMHRRTARCASLGSQWRSTWTSSQKL